MPSVDFYIAGWFLTAIIIFGLASLIYLVQEFVCWIIKRETKDRIKKHA